MYHRRSYVLAGTAALFLLALVRVTVFIVSGPSMTPTFVPGSLVFALPLWGHARPQLGDVVILTEPWENTSRAIKRIAGVPGDCIDSLGYRHSLTGVADPLGRCVIVAPGQYYVLGDSLKHSTDSRSRGTVNRAAITARVLAHLPPPFASGDAADVTHISDAVEMKKQ